MLHQIRRSLALATTSLVFAAILFAPATALADGVHPKPTYFLWSNLSYDNDNISGSSALAFASVGLDWFTLPNDLAAFNTYVGYKHMSRTMNPDYFDATGPLAGFEFRGKYLSLGMDYFSQKYPVQPITGGYSYSYGTPPTTVFVPIVRGPVASRWQEYATTYIDWNLSKNPGGRYLGLPGSIWANGTYDDYSYDPAGGLTVGGFSSQGFITQGIDWFKLPWNVVFNTFAQYSWRNKTGDNRYYDSYGPTVGIDLGKGAYHLGVDYYWQYYPSWPYGSTPSGPAQDNRLQIYFTLYLTNT